MSFDRGPGRNDWGRWAIDTRLQNEEIIRLLRNLNSHLQILTGLEIDPDEHEENT